jgi:lincosamide nucleotidyltransferase A/C/D/E
LGRRRLGVAALAGRQTREHRALDLAIDAEDLHTCLQALSQPGYAAETDWLPVRIELRAPGARWVDVHPVNSRADGHGRPPDLDGGHFDYPPTAFTTGSIGNRPVNCLSPQQQCRFRTGYEHRLQDTYDLEQAIVEPPESTAREMSVCTSCSAFTPLFDWGVGAAAGGLYR